MQDATASVGDATVADTDTEITPAAVLAALAARVRVDPFASDRTKALALLTGGQ